MSDFSQRASSYEQEAKWILDESFVRPLVPTPFGGGALLDVCTGTGVIAEYADNLGWKATGLDNNTDIMSYLDSRVTRVCGDANHLPFPDGSFDLVVCRQGLQYLDRDVAIGDMLRVSRGEVRLLHGFVRDEDIEGWRALFRATNRNNRNFFSDTLLMAAIQGHAPASVECTYLTTRETFRKTPETAAAVERFLAESPAFVANNHVADGEEGFTYTLNWVVHTIRK